MGEGKGKMEPGGESARLLVDSDDYLRSLTERLLHHSDRHRPRSDQLNCPIHQTCTYSGNLIQCEHHHYQGYHLCNHAHMERHPDLHRTACCSLMLARACHDRQQGMYRCAFRCCHWIGFQEAEFVTHVGERHAYRVQLLSDVLHLLVRDSVRTNGDCCMVCMKPKPGDRLLPHYIKRHLDVCTKLSSRVMLRVRGGGGGHSGC